MTDRRALGTGTLVGALLTAPLIGLLYLGDRLAETPFPPFDVFGWLTRILPGPIITFGLDLMIDGMRLVGLNVADTGKIAEQAMAVLTFWAGGAVLGGLFFALGRARWTRAARAVGLAAGGLLGLPAIVLSLTFGPGAENPVLALAWLLLLFLAWGLALGWSLERLYRPVAEPPALEGAAPPAPAAEVQRVSRREFLILMGGASAAITVVGAGLGAVLSRREEAAPTGEVAAGDPPVPTATPLPEEPGMVQPAPGTRSEITPVDDHYKVFIGLEPTEIEEEGYTLPITGLVDNPLMLTLADIRENYESTDRWVTLSCISGRIPTTLISTTRWTGVSLQQVIQDATPQAEARYLEITSGDGFFETIPLDLIASEPRIMLCYAWDGEPLPVGHGFPLRVWIPDRFGMKQPKWITAMEVTKVYKPGYWVQRGWDEAALVKTRSVIDTVAVDSALETEGQRLIPIGGIAFAGARGISKVEVQVDDGPWQEAELREPLSDTTWVIWRFDWPFSEGEHRFAVRCYQADGMLQPTEVDDPRPSGATGIHSVTERI